MLARRSEEPPKKGPKRQKKGGNGTVAVPQVPRPEENEPLEGQPIRWGRVLIAAAIGFVIVAVLIFRPGEEFDGIFDWFRRSQTLIIVAGLAFVLGLAAAYVAIQIPMVARRFDDATVRKSGLFRQMEDRLQRATTARQSDKDAHLADLEARGVLKLEAALSEANTALGLKTKEWEAASGQVVTLTKDLATRDRELADERRKSADLDGRLKRLRTEVAGEYEDRLTDQTTRAETAEDQLRLATERCMALDEIIDERHSLIAWLQSEVSRLQLRRDQIYRRQQIDLEAAVQARNGAQTELASANEALRLERIERGRLSHEVEELGNQLTALRESERTAGISSALQKDRITELLAEVAALREALAHHREQSSELATEASVLISTFNDRVAARTESERKKGLEEGLSAGREEGHALGKTEGYQEGYADGHAAGLVEAAESTPAVSPEEIVRLEEELSQLRTKVEEAERKARSAAQDAEDLRKTRLAFHGLRALVRGSPRNLPRHVFEAVRFQSQYREDVARSQDLLRTDSVDLRIRLASAGAHQTRDMDWERRYSIASARLGRQWFTQIGLMAEIVNLGEQDRLKGNISLLRDALVREVGQTHTLIGCLSQMVHGKRWGQISSTILDTAYTDEVTTVESMQTLPENIVGSLISTWSALAPLA